MPRVLYRGAGGTVSLPDPPTIMIDRANGGQLVVHPPRRVWDRTALDAAELTQWSFLVAATAAAMLDTLPQLRGGCINYWDAGNWALNPLAAPIGPKTAAAHRVLHQHVIGRSPHSTDPSWTWGEAPFYPVYEKRETWSAGKAPLTAAECGGLVSCLVHVLGHAYGVESAATDACVHCRYPAPAADLDGRRRVCPDCAREEGL